MKVVRRDMIDWEPLRVHVIFRRRQSLPMNIRETVGEWLRSRQRRGICGCTTKYEDHGFENAPGLFTFGCEWMCENCVQAFADFAARTWPDIDRVEIGEHDAAPIVPVTQSFIRVPAKTVLFEDGSTQRVESFEIARRCVTVGEYEQFVSATGYVTMAERQPQGRTFRDHELFPSKRGREQFPAYVIGYADAVAYCEWGNLRLPSDAEWLAASLLDENVYADADFHRVCEKLRKRPEALDFAGNDWTCTHVHQDKMAVRNSPQLTRSSDWAKFGRFIGLPMAEVDLMSTFRACAR